MNPFLHYLWAQTCICQGDLASLEVQIERLWKNPQLELDAKIEIIANCILKCFERDFQKEGTNIALKVIRDLPSKCNSAKAISLGMMLLQKGQFDDSTENVLELLNMIQDMIEDKLYLQGMFGKFFTEFAEVYKRLILSRLTNVLHSLATAYWALIILSHPSRLKHPPKVQKSNVRVIFIVSGRGLSWGKIKLSNTKD